MNFIKWVIRIVFLLSLFGAFSGSSEALAVAIVLALVSLLFDRWIFNILWGVFKFLFELISLPFK